MTRMYHEWKIPENLFWLEQTVKEMIKNEKKHENFINQCRNKYSILKNFFVFFVLIFFCIRCQSLFSKVPPNLYRHLILSDLKEVAVHLPAVNLLYESKILFKFQNLFFLAIRIHSNLYIRPNSTKKFDNFLHSTGKVCLNGKVF